MAVAPTYIGASHLGALNAVEGAVRDFAATGTVGASDTYATGGFTITPAALGLTKILSASPVVFSTGHWGFWTGSKLQVFSAAATELTDTSTALQGATFLFSGKGR